MGIIRKDDGMFRIARTLPRKHPREKMRRAAWLAFGDGSAPTGCVVWDLSKGGCRFTAPHSLDLPDLFVLIIRSNAKAYHFCRVVWRRGGNIGVEFIDPAEAERLSDALPANGTGGLYVKNDRAVWSVEQRKTAEPTVTARKPKNARKRPRFNIQLY